MSGKGLIYSSKHFEVRYTSNQPYSISKPDGVWLRICREDSKYNKDNIGNYTLERPIFVGFEVEQTFGDLVDHIFGRPSQKKPDTFRIRLKKEASKLIKIVDEEEKRILEFGKTQSKIIECKSEIDKTVSNVASEILSGGTLKT